MRAVRSLALATGAVGLLLVGTPVLGAGAAPAARPPATAGSPTLPLGPAGLPETRQVQTLAPGVTLTTIRRGFASASDVWVVTAGFFAARADADALAARLRSAGFDPRVEQVDGRAADDPQRGPVGYVVRVGREATEADANTLRSRLTSAPVSGVTVTGTSVTNTSLDGTPTTGPWVIRMLDVDPKRYRGSTSAELATDVVPDRETVSSLAARRSALAGVNGGYFVIPPSDGTPGDLAGISVLDGRLVSEAVNGRAALVLSENKPAEVERLSTALQLRSSDGAVRELDGTNRAPGLIRSCGEPGAVPTPRPKHDFTCTDANELISFDADFGPQLPAGSGAQVRLDRQGRVLTYEPSRGGTLAPGQTAVQGIGAGTEWLRAHARPGARLTPTMRLADEAGRRLELTKRDDVVNGGPYLVRDGREFVDAYTEGFVQPDRPDFFYGFGVRRNPRTMAGVAGNGHLLLVTADGRAPGYSVGLNFDEEAAVMRGLGARDALNLDGGGSTTMVANGRLLTRPSDTTGERPVGDAILLLPPTRPAGR